MRSRPRLHEFEFALQLCGIGFEFVQTPTETSSTLRSSCGWKENRGICQIRSVCWHIAVVAIVFALRMNQRSRGNQSRAAKLKPRGDEAAKSTPRFRTRDAQIHEDKAAEPKPRSEILGFGLRVFDVFAESPSRMCLRGFAVMIFGFAISNYRLRLRGIDFEASPKSNISF